MKRPLVSNDHDGIDLHVHSTASDGTLTPLEILATALQIGLKAVAITDHDTLAGSVEAMTAGIPPGLDFLPGIEISAAAIEGFAISGSIHILGYGIDPRHPLLNSVIDRLQTARQNRNPRIVLLLKKLGMELSMGELDQIVGNATAGRPHIAQLMVERGYAATIDDAFDRFLGKGKPAYVDKYRAPMVDAIDAINQAGGMAVLAHPFLNGVTEPAAFETFLLTLKEMGLAGIEAFYPEHPPSATDDYCRLARKHDLLITGGTDFHGAVTPGLQMGVGRGDFHVPYSIFEGLAVRLAH